MCLVGLMLPEREDEPLLVAANRDEFHARPTARAAFWDDARDVLGGRDLAAGGTWLGVNRSGRWALVTNHRSPEERKEASRSRGMLVAEYLRGSETPEAFAEASLTRAADTSAFNLVVGAGHRAFVVSSRLRRVTRLEPGVHALSNAELDTPWPKVSRLREGLAAGSLDDVSVFGLLADRRSAPDGDLPDTGVGLALEKILSPAFIVSPTYGTRSSTLVRVHRDKVDFTERSFDTEGREVGTRWFSVPLTSAA